MNHKDRYSVVVKWTIKSNLTDANEVFEYYKYVYVYIHFGSSYNFIVIISLRFKLVIKIESNFFTP